MGLLAVAAILTFTTANASQQIADTYACLLDGASVFPPVPPSPYPAVGRIDLSLNASFELSYQMYDCFGLSGFEAHIHGPAGLLQLGPVIFTIPPIPPNVGYRTGVLGVLNQQQIRDLNCGLWYIDIVTAQYPYGVVRGQLRGIWNWQPGWPCFLATQPSTWGAVKSLYRQ
jgi:hypothetical protein